MTRAHCNRCGGFVSPMPENRELFMTRGGLPLPTGPFADFVNAFRAARAKAANRHARRSHIDARQREIVNLALAGGRK